MQTWRIVGCIVTSFITSGFYFLILLCCLGNEEQEIINILCKGGSFLLKLPFLFLVPFLDYQVFGIDTLNFFVVLNIIFWGIIGMLLFLLLTRNINR